uniref:Uncharacterized protein n=1 Tax=Rhizophora mucronata TaxID=61149 RepID=A0A2P2QSG8_RHIMU
MKYEENKYKLSCQLSSSWLFLKVQKK